MTIAERKLLLRREGTSDRIDVHVAIKAIERATDMPEFVCCEVETADPEPHVERVYGLDALQALSLGILAIVNFLRNASQEGELFWPNGDAYDVDGDYSFIRPLDDIAKRLGVDKSE